MEIQVSNGAVDSEGIGPMIDGDRTLTAQLADWATRLRFQDLPADVAAGTAERIVDTLGVTLAGARCEFSRKLAAALAAPGEEELPLEEALLSPMLSGALASCLDFDDTHEETLIHPTAVVLFAALGAAASRPTSGRDLIAAVAIGTELACRIALAAPRAFHARGLHPTGLLGAFGAAAAAAWLLQPRARMLRDALGLAGSFGAGLMQPFADGTEQRYLHAGNAAAAGLLAARAAARGITGSPAVLEGRFGFFAVHVPDAAPFDFTAVTVGLGVRWASRSVSPKRYPTGYVTHPYIDAVLALAAEPGFDREDIARLVCFVPQNAVALVCEPRAEKLVPRNEIAARISLPHMLAEAIVHRTIDADSFSPARRRDARVRRLASRIEHAVAACAEEQRIDVQWHHAAPRELSVRPRPMTRDDIVAKFVSNAGPALAPAEARQLAGRILGLEAESDALALPRALFERSGAGQTL